MSKYIKLEDAEKLLTNALRIAQGFDEPLERSLVDLPTIDIVECKDCVHCADDWNGNQPQFTCELGMCTESVYPNDFCSAGERIEE